MHQFTDNMVPEAQLKRPRGLAYVLNVDGFGSQTVKVAKYHELRRARRPQLPARLQALLPRGREHDVPAQVMRLSPRPDVVVYE